MATIEQKITAQTNTNWWTSPVSSHQTHIVLTNDVFEFLGNQEKQITLQLYKEDFLKAAANILYSLPLNRKTANGSFLQHRSYKVIEELIFSIDKFFGSDSVKAYNVELSAETQNRKALKSLNVNGFNLRNYLVDGYSTLIFSDEGEEYTLRLISEKIEDISEEKALDNFKKIEGQLNVVTVRNTILYGPPGTGKTFKMQQIFARYDEDNRSMVTFHQSYSYEEFIVGLTAKTDEEGKVIYEYKKGVFYNACETAAKLAGYTDLADCCQDTKESRETRFAEIASDPSKQFLFCIDEINRANISSVFGDLISLIEEDKRLGTKNEMIVKLPYNQALFGVPANLHLLGTMNTADRSIQILDTALRRRFHFRELMPNYDVIKNETARNILTAINCRVRALLNKDRQIGHSYFFSIPEESSDAEIQILEAIRHKIIPLLQEYFYNEIGKIRFVMGEKGEPSSETDFFIYDEEANSSYRDYDADNEDVLFYKLNLKMLDEASVDNTKAKTILNHITQ